MKQSIIHKLILGLLIMALLYLVACSQGNEEIERASYLAGYQTFNSLQDRDINGITIQKTILQEIDKQTDPEDIKQYITMLLKLSNELIEIEKVMEEEEVDLSAMRWDSFKSGYIDAKFGYKPRLKGSIRE
jgi:hypothetical protein